MRYCCSGGSWGNEPSVCIMNGEKLGGKGGERESSMRKGAEEEEQEEVTQLEVVA